MSRILKKHIGFIQSLRAFRRAEKALPESREAIIFFCFFVCSGSFWRAKPMPQTCRKSLKNPPQHLPKSMPKPPKIEPKTLPNRGFAGVSLLGAVLGRPGGLLGASWVCFGAVLGPSWESWNVSGASWGCLETSWGRLGAHFIANSS